MSKVSAATLALFVAAVAQAAPSQYEFQYIYASGDVVSGSLVGELQSDNNTIVVSGFLDFVKFNGTNGPSIDHVISWFSYCCGDLPAVSLDGSFMDTLAWLDINDLGFMFLYRHDDSYTYKAYTAGTGFGGVGSSPYTEEFEPTRWQIQAANVPEPSALALLGLGLAGLGFARRGKAQ